MSEEHLTEQTETDETAEVTTVETTETTQDVDTDTDDAPEVDAQEGSKASREARNYRLRLRDTEAALETAQKGQETAQRALVEHLAQTVGRIKGEALWAAGTDLDALLTDGAVDADKVAEAADAAAAQLGLTRRPKPDPMQGRSTSGPVGSDWVGAFAPKG